MPTRFGRYTTRPRLYLWCMKFDRMPIEVESPEERGYDTIRYNLAESSIRDHVLEALPQELLRLTLAYTDHRGLLGLRALLAADAPGLTADHVLLTPGAAGALFFLHTALLSPGDEILVVRPNYSTNLFTPRGLGCRLLMHDLDPAHGYAYDVDRLLAAIRPGIKLVSVTTPHNPTGQTLCWPELQALADATQRIGATLLVDETYRDMTLDAPAPPLAATLGPHVVSVGSLSKSYGLPGLRLGWLLSTNPQLLHDTLAAKEQVIICNSIVDETLALHFARQCQALLPAILADLRQRRAEVDGYLHQDPRLFWRLPQGGCVGWVGIRTAQGQTPTDAQLAQFYTTLQDVEATMVGPGHWFEQSDAYFRLGYGWPTAPELTAGLHALSRALDAVDI